MRFALRFDIIAQKLAPVASGEVGEYLHVSKEIKEEGIFAFSFEK